MTGEASRQFRQFDRYEDLSREDLDVPSSLARHRSSTTPFSAGLSNACHGRFLDHRSMVCRT